jgi:hypothetical protein
MYHQVAQSNILHGIRLQVCALYGTQNKQKPMPDTSLTDWFLQAGWRVFTARYELNPYTKQISFFFKCLKT